MLYWLLQVCPKRPAIYAGGGDLMRGMARLSDLDSDFSTADHEAPRRTVRASVVVAVSR
jgi:hypothetical protein